MNKKVNSVSSQENGQNKDETTIKPSLNQKSEQTDALSLNDEKQQNSQNKNTNQNFLQLLKFVGFSISAGVIQLLSFELLFNWIGWKVWWASYLISIVLSVLWNFTFNRKFTFKSASSIPLAMTLVFLYYCAFTPLSIFGGGALENAGWNGTLVTVLMMIINFVTEFLFDKFVVFNDKVTNKILHKNKQSKTDKDLEQTSQENEKQEDILAENTSKEN